MNLENLNVVELSSEEMVETAGGHCGPYPAQEAWQYDCWCATMYVFQDVSPC